MEEYLTPVYWILSLLRNICSQCTGDYLFGEISEASVLDTRLPVGISAEYHGLMCFVYVEIPSGAEQ
jgi:hypothetical protein